jgi:REP element-mobilizing transposase RayT
MLYYRRRLPHWIPDHSVFFVTWRLAGSSPPRRAEFLTALNTSGGSSFVQKDELLARSSSGRFWLRDPRVASMVEEALRHGESVRKMYVLHAWVIMPNHVHVVMEPRHVLPRIMYWLKGRTARRANRILGRSGLPFWQDKSFDHWIRTAEEMEALISYVEHNPVHAGLVENGAEWPWSSANKPADDNQRSSAPQELAQR